MNSIDVANRLHPSLLRSVVVCPIATLEDLQMISVATMEADKPKKFLSPTPTEVYTKQVIGDSPT
jgi:hypothetical protein